MKHEFDENFGPLLQSECRDTLKFFRRLCGMPVRLLTMEQRTDVKDSHDRYANIEVSYLLQRLETYRGMALLATNHRGSRRRLAKCRFL